MLKKHAQSLESDVAHLRILKAQFLNLVQWNCQVL